ncbi:hypothetical protein MES4922_300182 [Mesorhizobium ventifaucium]|uniref:Uncharacterized protein n=1 Tax=Mesorhizobium ventifaucium TaxID=666020 RepID=A0ABN8JYE9_9HYPH|nr:hypothetical protein MES4922_300182 [Mesorhizobium ventifaucium]
MGAFFGHFAFAFIESRASDCIDAHFKSLSDWTSKLVCQHLNWVISHPIWSFIGPN